MKKLGLSVVALGLLLAIYVQVFELDGGISVFSVLLLLGTCLPYLVSGLLLFRIQQSLIPTCGAILPLFMDALTFDSVFLHPNSSTAAINLVIMPFWNLLLFLPMGLLIGWTLSRLPFFRK